MKKFVIIQVSVDQPTADDDGAMNAIGFGLASKKVFNTIEEAKQAREELILEDQEELSANCLTEEDGYESFIENGCYDERELNFYYDGEIVNSTRYSIEEVEF